MTDKPPRWPRHTPGAKDKKIPAFLFKPDKWFNHKITRMSRTAKADLIDLMAKIWHGTPTQFSIENDDKKLAKTLGITVRAWRKSKAEIQDKIDPCFIEKDGMLIAEDLRKQVQAYRLKSEKARKSVGHRWNERNTNEDTESIRTYNERNTKGDTKAIPLTTKTTKNFREGDGGDSNFRRARGTGSAKRDESASARKPEKVKSPPLPISDKLEEENPDPSGKAREAFREAWQEVFEDTWKPESPYEFTSFDELEIKKRVNFINVERIIAYAFYYHQTDLKVGVSEGEQVPTVDAFLSRAISRYSSTLNNGRKGWSVAKRDAKEFLTEKYPKLIRR